MIAHWEPLWPIRVVESCALSVALTWRHGYRSQQCVSLRMRVVSKRDVYFV